MRFIEKWLGRTRLTCICALSFIYLILFSVFLQHDLTAAYNRGSADIATDIAIVLHVQSWERLHAAMDAWASTTCVPLDGSPSNQCLRVNFLYFSSNVTAFPPLPTTSTLSIDSNFAAGTKTLTALRAGPSSISTSQVVLQS
jgi:hypothetical protein